MSARAMRRRGWVVGLLALCATTAAWAEEAAEVGKVTLVEGQGAVRKPDEGKGAPEALTEGSAIRVGDHLETGPGARLKLTLNDKSVLMLDEKSRLEINRAEFEAQTSQRTGFWASLGVGKVWAKVSRAVAGSDAKFEVRTERAVAGVRGTVFWVDAVTVVKGAKKTSSTRVRVSEGVVAVNSTAPVKKAAAPAPKGPRRQVAGPTEISKDQWEKQFLELQKGMVVVVDDELWTALVDQPEPDHAFAKFVRRNTRDE